MVPGIVFRGEVAIERHRKRQPGHQPIGLRFFVAEFVPQVETETTDRTHEQAETRQSEPAKIIGGNKPRTTNQHRKVQRHGDIDQQPVVKVRLQLRHDLLGRVTRIVLEEVIQKRHQYVDGYEWHPQGPFLPAPGHQAHADERDQGEKHRQQPEIPLLVTVADPPRRRVVERISLHGLYS